MNKNQKYYNPYPFMVRILNDLGEPYEMPPQDYSKVLNGRYALSKLILLPTGGEREFHNELDFKLEDCIKADLIPIAWAVGLDGVDQSSTKAKMIDMINEKIHETDFGSESDEDAPIDMDTTDQESLGDDENIGIGDVESIDDDTDDQNPHGFIEGNDELVELVEDDEKAEVKD